jgi:hypothetical protein
MGIVSSRWGACGTPGSQSDLGINEHFFPDVQVFKKISRGIFSTQ